MLLAITACAGQKSIREPDTVSLAPDTSTEPAPESTAESAPGRADIAVVTTVGTAGPADKAAAKKAEQAEDIEAEEDAASAPGDPVATMDVRRPGGDIADHIARSRRALEQGDPDRAILAARAALRVNSDAVEAISLLAAGYMRKGFHDRARSILEAATGRAPGATSAELWMQLGLVHEHDDVDRASAAYERATELKPNYARAWTNLGAVHIERGDHAEAVSALETALSLDAGSAAALTNLGTAYRRRAASATGAAREQYLRKAENHYLAVIRQDAEHAPAHMNLGLLYLDAEPFPGMDEVARLQAAVQHLRQFTRLGWDDARVAGAAGEYLEEAQRALQAAVERGQRNKRSKSSKGGKGGNSGKRPSKQ